MERTKRNHAHLGDRKSHTFLSATVRALGFSLILGAFFLCFLSFLLYRTPDPTKSATPVAVGLSLCLAALCGRRAARLRKRSDAVCGLAAGAMLAMLFMLTALCLTGGTLSLYAVLLYLGMPLAGAAGGGLRIGRRRRRRAP